MASSAPRSTLSQDIAAFLGVAAHGLRNPAELWTAVGPTMNELTGGLMGHSFQPGRDIPDLSGKVILVTGGTSPPSSLHPSSFLLLESDVDGVMARKETLVSAKRQSYN